MKLKNNSTRSIQLIDDSSILQIFRSKKWYRLVCSLIVAISCLSSTPKIVPKPTKQKIKKEKTALKHEEKPGSLELSSFDAILKRYLFIGDFSEKPDKRDISGSGEIFWRYPYKLAPQTFDLHLPQEEMTKMVFQVKGEGRLGELFAKGRVEFLNGEYDRAHETWLRARQTFSQDALINKRLEFFLGVNAAMALEPHLKRSKGDMKDPEFKRMINRVSYFLAAAFILRRDTADTQIDQFAPWGLYNLAVAYYKLERWSLVVGAAQEGLTNLLKLGKSDYRPKFRQMLAEMWIKNDDLLTAIQELDTAIRQDPNPQEAAKMFYRAGDIYYGLNNFDLADEVYGLGSRIEETNYKFSPSQALLRAESKFWMGKFSEARELLQAAVEASVKKDNDWVLESGALPWARLRIGDTLLAELKKTKPSDRKKLSDAVRLAYFRVETDHPQSEAARIAKIRGACMDLPSYEGNNVKHARSLLEDVQMKKDVPENLMELVNACYVSSYSDRERTPEMVQRVKEYASKYPNSKFLNGMLPAVTEVQARNIDPYFEKGYLFSGTEFFEKRRATLYKKIDEKLGRNLFQAYVDTSRSDKAKEFWNFERDAINTDEQLLRALVFLNETSPNKTTKNNLGHQKDLNRFITQAEKTKWKPNPPVQTKLYLSRVLSSNNSAKNLIWILNASEEWSKEEKDSVCSVTLPLSSRLFDSRKDKLAVAKIRERIDSVIPEKWETLLKENQTCAQSWLDLEAKTIPLNDLIQRYEKRATWVVDGPWLERLWIHSEELEKSGQKDAAQKLWQKIAKDAPPSSFESKMAKTRLAPPDTEVEGLWK
ncbi:MAG: hypothetical protein NT027_06600 [Proteobacteria bacterium]|nr:hypothetical protein [Pseudomonadota bacterium]